MLLLLKFWDTYHLLQKNTSVFGEFDLYGFVNA